MDNKVINATKWSMAAELAAKLISPIVNMVLARLLVPQAFGAVATITMIISFAEIFTDAGFQKYIVQHKFVDGDDLDKSVNVAFWSNFTLSSLIVLFIWIFREPIAILVGAPELSLGIAVASFSILFVAFSSIQMAVYKKSLQFKTLFYVRMIVSLIPLIVTIPFAVILRNYWALVIGTLCKDLIQAIILTARSEWKPRLFYSLKKFKEMFSFTAWTLLETVAIWLTAYIGTFIVGRTLSNYYLGLYKTSMTTVNSYMGIITAGITPVLFSALSKYQNDEEKFRATYFDFQKWVAILSIPMGLGIFIYRDLVVEILLGSQWSEASGFVGLWGLISSFSIVLNNFTSEVCRSKGKPQISLVAQLIQLAFLIPTIMVSINYGFKILYISRSLISLQNIIVSLIVVDRIFGIQIYKIIKNIFPQILSAIVMTIISCSIKDLLPGIVWQFVSIGISIIVYFIVLFTFPEMRETYISIINKRIKNKKQK